MLKPTSGLVVGGCRLDDVLGRGGMGTVYRGRQVALGREVAVKIVPLLGGDETNVSRFHREAQMAAALEHPHTIPIHAAGEESDLLYIVMRLVHGPDLKTLIRREGALEAERAVTLIEQVADALDAAHRAGLVHRDVKPANILVEDRDGADHAYLSDFGLVRSVTGGTALTATGQWLGTLDYIAPEQLEGEHVDHRADIYALACVLYTLVTGEVPFPRDGPASTAWAHVNAPRPPVDADAIPPPVARSLTHVVARGMAKDPDDRYPTAGGLARAARAALTRPSAEADPATAATEVRPAAVADPPTWIHSRPAATSAYAARHPIAEPGYRSRRISRWLTLVLLVIVFGAGTAAVVFGLTKASKHVGGSKPPAPPAFSQYRGPAFSVEYPAGWRVVESEQPIATFLRTEFASPDGRRRIVIDRSPSEGLPPRAKALAVESATARTSGYRRLAFFSTTLGGRDALEWEFVLSGQARPGRVDIFQHLSGSGYAVLGEAGTPGDILSITRRVAASLTPR